MSRCSKPHVPAQRRCLVCNQMYDARAIARDPTMQPVYEHHRDADAGLCHSDQLLYNAGYIALVEVDPGKSSVTTERRDGQEPYPTMLPQDAHRTGTVAHVPLHVSRRMFGGARHLDPHGKVWPVIFVTADVISRLEGARHMQAASIKQHWLSLHPTKRMDPAFWLAVCEDLHANNIVLDDATDEQVKAAIARVEEKGL